MNESLLCWYRSVLGVLPVKDEVPNDTLPEGTVQVIAHYPAVGSVASHEYITFISGGVMSYFNRGIKTDQLDRTTQFRVVTDVTSLRSGVGKRVIEEWCTEWKQGGDRSCHRFTSMFLRTLCGKVRHVSPLLSTASGRYYCNTIHCTCSFSRSFFFLRFHHLHIFFFFFFFFSRLLVDVRKHIRTHTLNTHTHTVQRSVEMHFVVSRGRQPKPARKKVCLHV